MQFKSGVYTWGDGQKRKSKYVCVIDRLLYEKTTPYRDKILCNHIQNEMRIRKGGKFTG